jgi:RNA polymerase sigma-70 factor (ECF subfamily)
VSADGDQLAELRRRFPSVDPTGFAGHLAACRQAGALDENTADLVLAWAAARGDRTALRQVDGLIAAIAPALRGIDGTPDFVDEVSQAVRVRLLVAAEPGSDPRIAAYRGRGPLGAWIRAAAMRVAIDRKRSAAPALAGADLLGDLVSGEPDPALRHLKTLHRADFQQALADALAALPDRQRAVLRLHHVDGLRLAEIGRLYGVHESTVSRWVTRAAEEVADQTRRRLTDRLSLSGSSVDSLARLVRSQLDLSIARILR